MFESLSILSSTGSRTQGLCRLGIAQVTGDQDAARDAELGRFRQRLEQVGLGLRIGLQFVLDQPGQLQAERALRNRLEHQQDGVPGAG
jgi:hypothetical protein